MQANSNSAILFFPFLIMQCSLVHFNIVGLFFQKYRLHFNILARLQRILA